MFFWNKFCGLIMIFFILSISVTAQNSIQLNYPVKNFYLESISISPNLSNIDKKVYFKNLELLNSSDIKQTTENLSPFISLNIIPANFSICNYGFFCKQELKVEKATNIPIRLRLGSLAQCNYYEGKP